MLGSPPIVESGNSELAVSSISAGSTTDLQAPDASKNPLALQSFSHMLSEEQGKPFSSSPPRLDDLQSGSGRSSEPASTSSGSASGTANFDGSPAGTPGSSSAHGSPAGTPGSSSAHGSPAGTPGSSSAHGSPAGTPGSSSIQEPSSVHDKTGQGPYAEDPDTERSIVTSAAGKLGSSLKNRSKKRGAVASMSKSTSRSRSNKNHVSSTVKEIGILPVAEGLDSASSKFGRAGAEKLDPPSSTGSIELGSSGLSKVSESKHPLDAVDIKGRPLTNEENTEATGAAISFTGEHGSQTSVEHNQGSSRHPTEAIDEIHASNHRSTQSLLTVDGSSVDSKESVYESAHLVSSEPSGGANNQISSSPNIASFSATAVQAPGKPPVELSPSSLNISEQVLNVVQPLTSTLLSGESILSIDLYPPALGTVRAVISSFDGSVVVKLWAATEHGHALLSQALPDLREHLGEGGTFSVSVDLSEFGSDQPDAGGTSNRTARDVAIKGASLSAQRSELSSEPTVRVGSSSSHLVDLLL